MSHVRDTKCAECQLLQILRLHFRGLQYGRSKRSRWEHFTAHEQSLCGRKSKHGSPKFKRRKCSGHFYFIDISSISYQSGCSSLCSFEISSYFDPSLTGVLSLRSPCHAFFGLEPLYSGDLRVFHSRCSLASIIHSEKV